ncbi:N-acetylglucosamine-1-phosphotransferase subunits alpha/beta isoform X2 [Zootermopsis nevadensis]|nr:N-acetylglucosamine-1-phosphotransferase subunits alpha/beta isoform X2 [Zootermopsis nevadensis]
MTWSQENYKAIFNSFSDNIVGKSLQSKLCQNVPIDAVYTWVNGSDPVLQQHLQQYHLQLQEEASKECPYADCVPSHIIIFRHWLSDETVSHVLLLPNIRGTNASLKHRMIIGSNNWTLIELNSPDEAAEVVKLMLQSNVTLLHAHWTSDSTVSKTNEDFNTVLISGIPSTLLEERRSILHADLKKHMQSNIEHLWVYSEKRLVVVKVDTAETVNRIVQLTNRMTIGGSVVNISKAYLILELPLTDNSKDFSPSRFEDKEELRYSLRSLERFAPWVRHVYLVTNGQIPYWLDLENPRLTIVTHDQIFPNLSHLPTFSSPAIESHIHRIPGLSRKFLYLNDDVMFGKEVWPDDFITNSNGQKVYLSWPVPDCSDSCPWSWVADGSCDVTCNISECSFDGGDCGLSTEDDIGIYDENQRFANYDDDINSYNENQHESVKENLFFNMNFGGDIALNDLPDPGKRMHSLLDTLTKKNIKKDHLKGNLSHFTVDTYPHEDIKFASERTANQDTRNTNPQPYKGMYGSERNNTLYLQRIVQVQQKRNYNTNSGKTFIIPGSSLIFQQKHNQDKDNNLQVRTRMVNNNNGTSFQHNNFGNNGTDLHKNHISDGEMHGWFYPRLLKQNTGNLKESELKSNGNNKFVGMGNWQTIQSSKYSKENANHNLLYSVETVSGKFNENQNVHVASKFNQTYGSEKVISLQAIKNKPARNVSSYNAKLHKLYKKLNGKSDEPGRLYAKHNAASADKNLINSELQYNDYDVHWKNEDIVSKVSKKKHKTLKMYDAQQYDNSLSTGKKPRDTFAESLLYVNRLYNQEFGFEPRKVPAHMPHLIDIDIMEQLQARFSQQLQLTSSHKVRNAHDMQFAFSYFYFLMSSKVILPLSDIFDIFDTDHSGTWSDREIRTLLTRLYDLPLRYAGVVKFENDIINCSKELSEELSSINISTPPYERYLDSKLPVVSKTLISNCKPVADILMKKFGNKKMYQYQLQRDKHQDVSFKMLNSNISQLVSHLDDIRRDPKKFICLNDNLDPKREEDNAVARAILQDMYESLFPKPSSFELPPEFRNRFLHITELQAWRANRNTIRTVVYIGLAILITFTLINFFHVEFRWLQRKLCQRTRQQYHGDAPMFSCV